MRYKVRFLGVNIGEKIDELNEENFHNTVQKMMQSLHFWKGKYLSRKGLPRTVNTYSLSMLFYITETQEPSKLQIDNINKEINKIVKRDKKTSIDMIKLPYNKGGLNLCDIRTKIDAQRVKWLIEALNSPTDSIEYYLVNENLGVYKHHTIGEIKGFNLLRYRPPINKITGITSFYKSCLKSWYDINPKYRVNNQAELDTEFIPESKNS